MRRTNRRRFRYRIRHRIRYRIRCRIRRRKGALFLVGDIHIELLPLYNEVLPPGLVHFERFKFLLAIENREVESSHVSSAGGISKDEMKTDAIWADIISSTKIRHICKTEDSKKKFRRRRGFDAASVRSLHAPSFGSLRILRNGTAAVSFRLVASRNLTLHHHAHHVSSRPHQGIDVVF
jgi:hypothetical protein